jgi:hypothetical protein
VARDKPKIKTERDYLNEIIRAQQAKENSQKKSSMNIPLFQTKMSDNVKMNDNESMVGANVKYNHDEIPIPERIVYPLP